MCGCSSVAVAVFALAILIFWITGQPWALTIAIAIAIVEVITLGRMKYIDE